MAKRKNFKANLVKQSVKQVVQQTVQQAVGRAVQKDPKILETQTKYQKNGLTFQSNNNNIIPRDQAGNIKLQESVTDNPLLIIEAASTKILNNSVLKVIDTQFNYFKFPATTRIIGTDDVDINLDLDLTVDQEAEDVIYARYKPSENRKILSSQTATPSGILIDELEEGQLQKRPNKYYITKQIKESGIDLRFRIKIQVTHKGKGPGLEQNTIYFYISLAGPNKLLDREYKEPFIYSGWDNSQAGGGLIKLSDIGKFAYADIVIENKEFEVGDTFSITALAGINENEAFTTILADQSYWSITDASKNVDEWNREI